jgi:hypothetical protein
LVDTTQANANKKALGFQISDTRGFSGLAIPTTKEPSGLDSGLTSGLASGSTSGLASGLPSGLPSGLFCGLPYQAEKNIKQMKMKKK